ncbi:MAG: hypothetical protein NXI14_06325 [bacterium]|nr:hypothetical protein [bacterium]
MKTSLLLGVGTVLGLGCGSAVAGTYADFDDDIFDTGVQNLDIRSVTVTNDDTWVYFAIQTDADLDATVWGKYMVALDTRAGGSDSNGWNRTNINHNADNDFWIGSWADDGGSGAGANLFEYNSGWSEIDATYTGNGLVSASDADHASGIQRLAVKISALGLSIGDTFGFDVMSSGGGDGDSGIDHLSVQGLATDWWTNPSSAGSYLQYTLQSTVIPLPSGAGLALAGMGLIGLRRRR